eukprot:g230.t1
MVLRLVLSIRYSNGHIQRVESAADESWQVTAGPIVFDDSYAGEVYDARLAIAGWSTSSFTPRVHDGTGAGRRWRAASAVATPPGAVLSTMLMPPVRKEEVYTAIRMWAPQHDETCFSFGQNVAGVIEIQLPEGCTRGTSFTVTHGEALHPPAGAELGPGRVFHLYSGSAEGNGMTGYLRYICSGNESHADGSSTWSPLFFTSGGQYVKISREEAGDSEGGEVPRQPFAWAREDVRLHGVYVGVERIGQMTSSVDTVNQIMRITRASILGNLAFGIPTDCPTREKRGWLDSAHGLAPTAMTQFDMGATYTVFLRTIQDAQRFFGKGTGNMPDYTPAFGSGLTLDVNGNGDSHGDGEAGLQLADPGWAVAHCFLVEYLWQHYHDSRVWERHYPDVSAYVRLLAEKAVDPSTGLLMYARFGDWCPYKWANGPKAYMASNGMNMCYGLSPLASSFFYLRQLEILARAATRLGNSSDAAYFTSKLIRARGAFRDHFWDDPSAQFKNAGTQGLQGSAAMALALDGVFSTAQRATMQRMLVRDVASRGYHLNTGELSLGYLLPALAEAGRPELPMAMSTTRTQPGWAFMIDQGATTLWESWYTDRYGSIGSRNHDMFGAQGAYYFSHVAGVQMLPQPQPQPQSQSQSQRIHEDDTSTVGWARFRIKPYLYNYWQDRTAQQRSIVRVRAAQLGCSASRAHPDVPCSPVDITVNVSAACNGRASCTSTLLEPGHSPSPLPQPPASEGRFIGAPIMGLWWQTNQTKHFVASCDMCGHDLCDPNPGPKVQWWGVYETDAFVRGLQTGAPFNCTMCDEKCFARRDPKHPLTLRDVTVNYTCVDVGAGRGQRQGQGKGPGAKQSRLGEEKTAHLPADHDGFTESTSMPISLDCTPPAPLEWSRAVFTSPRGTIESSWRLFPRHMHNQTAVPLCAVVDENTYTKSLPPAFGAAASQPSRLTLGCTQGLIEKVMFASYGLPHGTCGNLSLNPDCDHPGSVQHVSELCVGKRSCTVAVDPSNFTNGTACYRSGLWPGRAPPLNVGPHRLAIALAGCTSAPLLELNVTIPIGATAEVVLPTEALGVDANASTTVVSEGASVWWGGGKTAVPPGPGVRRSAELGGLVAELGSGQYRIVLSAAII